MEFTQESLDLMSGFISSLDSSLDSSKDSSKDLSKDLSKETIPKSKFSNKNKIRCAQCMKKLSMMSFECKCGNMYCITHQTPHMHNCSYNYKNDLQNKIEKDNPKLGQKLIKI